MVCYRPRLSCLRPQESGNTRLAARRFRGDILRENCLARFQSLSNYRIILRDCLVNQRDCTQDDLWDEPVDE